jgi:hypothetical protein
MSTVALGLPSYGVMGVPSQNNFQAWSFNPSKVAYSSSPAGAGALTVQKIIIPEPITVSSMGVFVGTAASGSTPPSSIWYALFNSSGTRLGTSTTDAGSSWTTKGYRPETLTADASGSLSLPVGWLWGAFLVGAAGSTPALLVARGFGVATPPNTNLLNSSNLQASASVPLRSFKITGIGTSMPTSIATQISAGGLSPTLNFFIGVA